MPCAASFRLVGSAAQAQEFGPPSVAVHVSAHCLAAVLHPGPSNAADLGTKDTRRVNALRVYFISMLII